MNFRNWRCENCHSTEEPLRFGDKFECPCCGKTYTIEEMNSLLNGSLEPSFNEPSFEDIDFFKDANIETPKEEIKESQDPKEIEGSNCGVAVQKLDDNYGDFDVITEGKIEDVNSSETEVEEQECETEYVNIYEKQPVISNDNKDSQVQEIELKEEKEQKDKPIVKNLTREQNYVNRTNKIRDIIKSTLDGSQINKKDEGIRVLDELTEIYNDGWYAAAPLLGICYETGIFVPKADIKKAIDYYKVGCEHDSTLGYLNYANCLVKGIGVEKNPALAMEYYKKAADKKNSRAALIYANACYYGKDIEQSYPIAFEYYKKAADKKNPYAKYNLAQCYIKGRGVEKDLEEGLNILRKLKDDNFEPAIKWLKDNNYQ